MSPGITQHLTKRDKEVITLLCAGLNHRETANIMGIAQQVVSRHVKKIRKFLKGGKYPLPYIDNWIHNVSGTSPPDLEPAGRMATPMGSTRHGKDKQGAENFRPATESRNGGAGRLWRPLSADRAGRRDRPGENHAGLQLP